MPKYTESITKILREWSTEAYRREMEREVKNLESDISAWKQGRISSEELSHRIHAWDAGPSKALSKQYDYGQVDANVAYAVVVGIIQERELPEELRQAIEPTLESYRKLQENGKLADRIGVWWK